MSLETCAENTNSDFVKQKNLSCFDFELNFLWSLASSNILEQREHGSLESIAHRPTRARAIRSYACVCHDHIHEEASLCHKHLTIVMQSTNPYSWSRPAFLLLAVMCIVLCICVYVWILGHTHTRVVNDPTSVMIHKDQTRLSNLHGSRMLRLNASYIYRVSQKFLPIAFV